MGRHVSVLSMVASGMFLIAACGAPAAAPTATIAPTVAPTVAPMNEPTVEPTAAGTSDVNVEIAKVMVGDTPLGKILVGDFGLTLYMFKKDSNGSSSCYDQCAIAWPPLLTKDKPQAGDGAEAMLLGTTTRKDGTTQVTYKGMPLYYYAKDKAAGDVIGQDVGSAWYVLAPDGSVIDMKNAASAATPAMSAGEVVTVNVTKTSLGQILVDAKGMTLYMFANDANGESACYDQCAKNWPPLMVPEKATAGTGIDASLLGTTKRKDGSLQVTYKGMPLYLFAKDNATGDVLGQGVGSVWYVVGANGEVIKGASGGAGANGYGN
jgi:predicted lipoprotein with Yx(FWY)xxD motif